MFLRTPRPRRRAAGLLAGFLLLALPVRAASSQSASTLASPSMFLSKSGALTLTIQLVDPGVEPVGQFDFVVQGVGDYEGTAAVIPFGKDKFRLRAVVPAQLFPADGGAPTTITVAIKGILEPSRPLANVLLWPGVSAMPTDGDADLDDRDDVDVVEIGPPYHLRTHAAPPPDPTVRQVLTAVTTQDWVGLYGQLAPEIQQTLTQAEFAQAMSSGPKILSAVASGQGQLETASGVTYFMQPLSLTVQQFGGPSPATCSLYLILEQGTWRFLSTSQPS